MTIITQSKVDSYYNYPLHKSPAPKPPQPVELIQHLFAQKLFIPFLETAHQNFKIPQTSIETDCCLNTLALSLLFTGMRGANRYLQKVNHFEGLYHHTIKLPLQPAGTTYTFKMTDFSASLGILEAEQMLVSIEEDTYENRAQLFKRNRPRYNKTLMDRLMSLANSETSPDMDPEKSKAQADHFLTHLEFPFNAPVLSILKEKIDDHSLLLDNKNSLLYSFEVRIEALLFHSFSIEQFYHPEHPKGLYRLYQAWRDRMTLEEYLQKRGADHCLTYDQMKGFIEDLAKMFRNPANETSEREKDLINIQNKYFLTNDPSFPPFFYYPDVKRMGGFHLRFTWERFNPNDCTRNYFLVKPNQ